jgi:pyrroloquinoline quinone biosynthesis protein E
MLALAEELEADRVELANTQYYGWGLHNRDALMPTREQVERSRDVFEEARLRLGSRMDLLYVIPDYFEEFPKPCMGGWGRRAIVMAPNGDAMPCQAAASIPDLTFPNVRDHSLDWIWWESETFNRFRGYEWMQEPCRSCARRDLDFGGCRCQALLLAGDASATDPVCSLSPLHHIVVQARENPESRPLVPLEYRSMKGTALSR